MVRKGADIENRSIKETTVIRVISALLISDLSWSQLLERTDLSKNTLAAVIRDLKKSGYLGYSLSEEVRERRRPSIAYTLSDAAKKKYSEIVSVMQKIKNTEKLFLELSENMRSLPKKNLAERKETFASYYKLASKASLSILETGLEWKPTNTYLDDAVAAASISTARRILLLQNLPEEISDGIREDLVWDRDRLVKDLERENEHVKRQLKKSASTLKLK